MPMNVYWTLKVHRSTLSFVQNISV